MFPLRDKIPSQSFPIVTILIILTNILVYTYQLSLGEQLNSFIRSLGVVPTLYANILQINHYYILFLFPPLFTSMFLHGGFFHLLGNMWYLWIFGDNVEDYLGHIRYFFFYLTCGLLGNIAHIFMNINSTVPTIGASGAIAGIMGAYILLYPRSRITTFLFLIIFFTVLEIPAIFFLGFWILLQLLYATFSVGNSGNGGGVAWWAHIGGFSSGLLIMLFYRIVKNN